MKKHIEKKIRLERAIEKKRTIAPYTRETEIVTIPMHYFYLCMGQEKIFLCKQRSYRGVERYFRKDLPVESIRRHRWNCDKMVDHLMDKLPKYLKYAEHYAAELTA